MASNDQEEMDFSTDKDLEDYDIVLVFSNPYNDPGLGLKSDYSAELTLKKAVKYLKRIFHLDQIEDMSVPLFKEIQQEIDDFGNNNTHLQTVEVEQVAQITVKNLLKVLQHHFMFDLYPFYSRDRDEIFVKLRASEESLQVQADLDDYKLQLKKQIMDILPYQQVQPYAPYEKTSIISKAEYKKFDTYDRESQQGSHFQYKDRARLIYKTICANLDLSLLKTLGILKTYMPLHRSIQLDILKHNWGNVCARLKKQDADLIRLYFGEKVAMYFVWLEFLLIWMTVPAIFGFLLGIVDLSVKNDPDDGFTTGEFIEIIFALFLPVFGVVYEQMWIRKERELAWRWGTYYLEEIEDQRPEFKGTYSLDAVTGKIRKQRKTTEWIRLKKTLSLGISLMFVLIVLVAVISLFLYRATLNQDSWGPTAIGIVNAIQIKIFNTIYSYVAVWLNKIENYEYPSKYNDGLTGKLFLFQFMNSYTSLFYIAFAKDFVEGCSENNCIAELELQLATIFLTNFSLNIMELCLPFVMEKYRNYTEEQKIRKMAESMANVRTRLSAAEAQHKQSEYDTPLSDYMEVVISLGYVLIFSASFPLASPVLWLLVLLELKVDAFKLCRLTQRPFPDYANTIGVWLNIVKRIIIVATITNVALIVFTSNPLNLEDTGRKWLLFIIIEHVLFIMQYGVSFAIADTPLIVERGLAWSKRIIEENLYGKLSDGNQARKERNLEFVPPRDRQVFDSDYRGFPMADKV